MTLAVALWPQNVSNETARKVNRVGLSYITWSDNILCQHFLNGSSLDINTRGVK